MTTTNTQHLCRGKRLDGGGRVEGYYACVAGEAHVIFTGQIDITTIATEGGIRWERFEVDPATVGRCTGLTDKGGKLIFEGDILEVTTLDTGEKRNIVVGYGEFVDVNSGEKHMGFYMEMAGDCVSILQEADGKNISDLAEIIGTIHDNPELLER